MKKILFIGLCCLCLCGCKSEKIQDIPNNRQDDNKPQQDNNNKQDDIFTIGEKLVAYGSNNEPLYAITFTKVTETDYRNDSKQADKVVIIEYEYENISQEDGLRISPELNFKLYDKDKNNLETYAVDYISIGESFQLPSNINIGEKATVKQAYALNNSNNYIELKYYDNLFMEPIATIILEW